MKYIIYIFIIVTATTSCSQISSSGDKEEIQKLKERNKTLEDEVQTLKSKYEPDKKAKKNYFVIGSTEDEVIEVMGQPSSYMITAPEAKKFIYGLSTVYFYRGKVISYDNLDDNLKVRVK
jgi:hypothetical protein